MNISYYGSELILDWFLRANIWTLFEAPTLSNYKILSTDYENYSIVFNCEKRGDRSKEWFALLSRNRTLSAEVQDEVQGLVDEYFDRQNSIFVIEDQGEKSVLIEIFEFFFNFDTFRCNECFQEI